jgi:protein-disulfide isomerase
MTQYIKSAAAGFVGAVVALAGAFGAAHFGWLPSANGSAVRDYLLAHPEILVEASNKLQAQQDASDDSSRQTAVNKLGMKAFFNRQVAFVTGPADAKNTIVEFFDYNCPYCRASLPAVKQFYDTHKDTRFAFIEFPIKGTKSTLAARAAIAAQKQPDKYLPFHFALMSEENMVDEKLVYADAEKAGLDVNKLKADMKSSDVDLTLASTHSLAQAIGVDGTPAFIINGKVREGALDEGVLKQMIGH